MNNIEKCEGYKLGYKRAYAKVMGDKTVTENPFEPMTFEYDNYWEGLIDGKDDAKMKKFKKKFNNLG